MKLFCLILLTFLSAHGIGFNASAQHHQDQTEEYRTPVPDPQDSVIIRLAVNRLIIENLQKNDVLEIYNIMGVKVYSRRVNAGTNEYLLPLPKGYYILKIGKLTKKIAIR